MHLEAFIVSAITGTISVSYPALTPTSAASGRHRCSAVSEWPGKSLYLVTVRTLGEQFDRATVECLGERALHVRIRQPEPE